jgi:hypothetical protein
LEEDDTTQAMKFGPGVVIAALALGGAAVSTGAFTVHRVTTTSLPRTTTNQKHQQHQLGIGSINTNLVRSGRRGGTTRQWLAESDDDDDDDHEDQDFQDDDEPLAKGVDSVSWLPSVLETKTVEMGGPADAGTVRKRKVSLRICGCM